MKSSGIGGQAVIEGVMMKNGSQYAVAVRKPDQEIDVKVTDYKSAVKAELLTKIPFIRGIFNFIDSFVLGMKTLTYSASFYEDDEEPTKADRILEKLFGDKGEKVIMGCTMCLSVVLAIAIFMVLPYYIAGLLKTVIVSDALLALAEGVVRILLFLLYITLISRMKDIQRVFMYHGAEHKCINCVEQGLDLTVENVMKSSKQHKRCGTSFLLIVMVVSVIFYIFIRVDSPVWRVLLRILLVPLIAGVSYEFIRLAGSSRNRVVESLSKPGMLLQNLTTREPDESMVAVAIASVEAVFDWKAYQEENFPNRPAARKQEKSETKQALEKNYEFSEEIHPDASAAEKTEQESVSAGQESSEEKEEVLQETVSLDTDHAEQEAGLENPLYINRQKVPEKSKADILPAPVIQSVKAQSHTSVKLKWSHVKGAAGYVLYRRTGEEDSYRVVHDILKNSFTDNDVSQGVWYHYRIRAFKRTGLEKVYGEYSNPKSYSYHE